VIHRTIDLSFFENQNLPLEGTGSVVLDRINRKAFVALSLRSTWPALESFCQEMDYQPVVFTSRVKGQPTFHTNVILSVGANFAVVCLDAVENADEQAHLIGELFPKKIIPITLDQVNHMCGNILELKTTEKKSAILMSREAYTHFTDDQIAELKNFGEFIVVDIPVIEKIGGGSARCIVAEIF
jgi:hypothetical protein